jgi:hypothetical protein
VRGGGNPNGHAPSSRSRDRRAVRPTESGALVVDQRSRRELKMKSSMTRAGRADKLGLDWETSIGGSGCVGHRRPGQVRVTSSWSDRPFEARLKAEAQESSVGPAPLRGGRRGWGGALVASRSKASLMRCARSISPPSRSGCQSWSWLMRASRMMSSEGTVRKSRGDRPSSA